MKKRLFVFCMLLTTIFVLGCAEETPQLPAPIPPPEPEQTPVPEPESEPEPAQTQPPQQEPEDGVVEIIMKARQWEFEPDEVRVKRGDKVKLIITSEDVDHGFELQRYDVAGTLKAGKTTVIEFTASQLGTFDFFCNVYCGSGHAHMRGQLVVERE